MGLYFYQSPARRSHTRHRGRHVAVRGSRPTQTCFHDLNIPTIPPSRTLRRSNGLVCTVSNIRHKEYRVFKSYLEGREPSPLLRGLSLRGGCPRHHYVSCPSGLYRILHAAGEAATLARLVRVLGAPIPRPPMDVHELWASLPVGARAACTDAHRGARSLLHRTISPSCGGGRSERAGCAGSRERPRWWCGVRRTPPASELRSGCRRLLPGSGILSQSPFRAGTVLRGRGRRAAGVRTRVIRCRYHESSCCYGDMGAFVREVQQVLRPNGHFLYADFHWRTELDTWRAGLLATGLRLVAERDITRLETRLECWPSHC